MKYDQFVERLDRQLQSLDCDIWRNTQISDSREVALFATRIDWSMVRIPVHLFVDYVDKPVPDDFISFFEEGIAYAKRAFSGDNILKIWGSSFAIINCIACDDASQQTLDFVKKRHLLLRQHLKHWNHGFEFLPVLYMLETQDVHYWKDFDFTGSAVWPFARKFVKDSIIAANDKSF